MNSFDPSVETGMSLGLKMQINDIRNALQGQSALCNHIGQVDSWQRQINQAASRGGGATDPLVAGQIDSALDGLIKGYGAGDLQENAQAAFKQHAMAQALARAQAPIRCGRLSFTIRSRNSRGSRPWRIFTGSAPRAMAD